MRAVETSPSANALLVHGGEQPEALKSMIEMLLNPWIPVAGELVFGMSFCTFIVAGVVALANPATVRSRRRRG